MSTRCACGMTHGPEHLLVLKENDQIATVFETIAAEIKPLTQPAEGEEPIPHMHSYAQAEYDKLTNYARLIRDRHNIGR